MKKRGLSIMAAGAALVLFAAVAVTQDADLSGRADDGPQGESLLGRLGSALAGARDTDSTVIAQLEPSPAPTAPSPTVPPANGAAPGMPPNGDLIEMSRPGAFNIHVRGMDLRTALKLLSTQGRRNIVASKEVTGQVTADLYGVTFHEALEAILKATGFVYMEQDNFIYVYTPEQLAAIQTAQRQVSVRLFRLDYTTPQDIRSLIEPALSSEGIIAMSGGGQDAAGSAGGIAGGDSSAASPMVVVRDYEENLGAIARIIEDVDVRPMQVLIEATILSARLNEENSLGIDWTLLGGVDFDVMATGGGGSEGLVPAGRLTASFPNWATTPFDFGISAGGGGLSMGVAHGRIAAFIQAMESVADTTVLANPKLMVLNRQRGEVIIGNEDGYKTTVITDTITTERIEFLTTGTRLVVRPFIGRDGYIRMEIHPEDSSGTVTVVGDSALPSKSTTEVTTNMIVRDGHTIVIGGLFRELTTRNRSQVPVAGNIPYVGSLFRSTGDRTIREEVMVLITPRIIRHEEDERIGEQMRYEAERQRIGARNGLQWWGRSRLAQTHLRWAREELARGNRDATLWNLDMVLSLEPRFQEAIRMKERLTGEAYWSQQGRQSDIRHIIERMMMQEMGEPMDSILPPHRPLRGDDIPAHVRDAFGIEDLILMPLPEPPAGPPHSAADDFEAWLMRTGRTEAPTIPNVDTWYPVGEALVPRPEATETVTLPAPPPAANKEDELVILDEAPAPAAEPDLDDWADLLDELFLPDLESEIPLSLERLPGEEG